MAQYHIRNSLTGLFFAAAYDSGGSLINQLQGAGIDSFGWSDWDHAKPYKTKKAMREDIDVLNAHGYNVWNLIGYNAAQDHPLADDHTGANVIEKPRTYPGFDGYDKAIDDGLYRYTYAGLGTANVNHELFMRGLGHRAALKELFENALKRIEKEENIEGLYS